MQGSIALMFSGFISALIGWLLYGGRSGIIAGYRKNIYVNERILSRKAGIWIMVTGLLSISGVAGMIFLAALGIDEKFGDMILFMIIPLNLIIISAYVISEIRKNIQQKF